MKVASDLLKSVQGHEGTEVWEVSDGLFGAQPVVSETGEPNDAHDNCHGQILEYFTHGHRRPRSLLRGSHPTASKGAIRVGPVSDKLPEC